MRVRPQGIPQLGVGERARAVVDQQGQELESLRRQLDALIGPAQLTGLRVEHPLAEPHPHSDAR